VNKKTLVILYMVLAHVCIVMLIIKPIFLSKLYYSAVKNEELGSFYHTMRDFHRRIDQNLPDGSHIFIGDSIIQGLSTSNIASNTVNYGIGEDTTVGVINRLNSYNSVHKARSVILAIGHNDFYYRSEKQIIINFQTIISMLPTNTKVIISAVLPVDEYAQDNITNQQVISLNTQLAKLSGSYTNTDYIDIGQNSPFGGALSPEYHIGDGVHLNKEGYSLLINELKAVINKMNKEEKGICKE